MKKIYHVLLLLLPVILTAQTSVQGTENGSIILTPKGLQGSANSMAGGGNPAGGSNALKSTTVYNNSVEASLANGNTKIYLNATKEGESTYANSPYFYPDLYLGGHQTANRRFFNGALDDLRIYNRALSDAEVTAIYNAEKP